MDSPGVFHPMFRKLDLPAELPCPCMTSSCLFRMFIEVAKDHSAFSLSSLCFPSARCRSWESSASLQGSGEWIQHTGQVLPEPSTPPGTTHMLKGSTHLSLLWRMGISSPFNWLKEITEKQKCVQKLFLKCNYVNCSNWTKGGGRWFCRQTSPPDLVSTGDLDQKASAEFINLTPTTTSLHKLVRNPLLEKSKLVRVVGISFLAIHFPLHADYLSSLDWHSCVNYAILPFCPHWFLV